jgi:hypothetical protein
MDQIILIKDFPPALLSAIAGQLAPYTIAFLRSDDRAAGHRVHLLGSGVLISVGKTRAILTAQHVLQVLPRTGRLAVFLERTREPHTIDTHGIAFVDIARGTQDSVGPDLGAVVLASRIGSAIAAKKPFYNLDAHRDRLLGSPPDLQDGVWCAQGFLAERTVVTTDPSEGGFTKWFYNFSGFGGPENSTQVDEHDYFEFPVSHESRADAPVDWGGMSGGGLWQIPLKRQDEEIVPLSPLLSGVLFYQQPTTDTQCGVKGHGRRSVYEVAYNAIRAREPQQPDAPADASRRPPG